MRLVLFGTSGNQAYVFASNRLREAVGASYLISEATTSVVRDLGKDHEAEVLQCSSGSALVVVPTEGHARGLVAAVTEHAVRKAPGLQVLGVHMDIGAVPPSPDEIREIYRLWRWHASRSVGVAARWPRLPVVAACGSTDAPAAAWYSDSVPRRGTPSDAEVPRPLSAQVIAKRRARPAADRRMKALLDRTPAGKGLRLVGTAELFEDVEWVGVVHADANRLGQFFVDAAGLPNTQMGALSTAIQRCAENAFGEAVAQVAGLAKRTQELPVVPLVIGGDDLTALVDGRYALAFTTRYLTAFGEYAAADPVVRAAVHAIGNGALTVSAGVAVVKPHFPFSTAYQLAGELCDSAKSVAKEHRGSHALDVHVLLDSTFTDLERIRQGYQVVDGDGELSVTARPFLVPTRESATIPPDRDWTKLAERLTVVREMPVAADGRVVTRTQLHALRDELRRDVKRAERRLSDLKRRAVTEEDRAMLRALAGDSAGVRNGTGVLPALDLLELAEFAELEVSA
ncbi:Cas10/Cmr2 second palm domain-containing protein [Gandjariella thermophila]|uniref:Cas10/Cmr2 second palm domain-containing protein n=1 Tax=Gandjariella thermophila TaxID=1931992 RepID=A0A4D4JB02_9PSEU|nr:hypothetical protein GTS_34710 [Gandjariella thermophila]